MNRFVSGTKIDGNFTRTEKGGLTYASSGNPHLDFLFHAGTSRSDYAVEHAKSLFALSFADNPLTALRVLFFVRSVRKGLGERRVFREIINSISKGDYGSNAIFGLQKNLAAIAEHGRFDDYDYIIVGPEKDLSRQAAQFWLSQIEQGNRLAAKWSPRETNSKRRYVYSRLVGEIRDALLRHKNRSYVNDSVVRRVYRKAIANTSDTVEQKMSSNDWQKIEYGHVPAVAVRKYRKAFERHDSIGWRDYLLKLQTGKAKVNVGSVPGDLVRGYLKPHPDPKDPLIEQQWQTMIAKLGIPGGILPMIDTSGSMFWTRMAGYLPIEHAVGVGLAITNSQPEPWKGMALTFSGNSKLEYTNPSLSLYEQVNRIKNLNWGGTTNIQSGFEAILKHALRHNVQPEDMPQYLVIMSDMEFDQANRYQGTSYQAAEALYKQHGYELPVVIFWNLAASTGGQGRGNVPVMADDARTVLISGFSVNALNYIFNLDNPGHLIDEINEVMTDITAW